MERNRRWPWSVVLSLLALAALLFIARARGVLWASLQLTLGLLFVCGGIGFVLAPLLRRRAGRATAADRHPWRHRAFVIGLVATLIGLALTGLALWRLVSEQAAVHALGSLVAAATVAS